MQEAILNESVNYNDHKEKTIIELKQKFLTI